MSQKKEIELKSSGEINDFLIISSQPSPTEEDVIRFHGNQMVWLYEDYPQHLGLQILTPQELKKLPAQSKNDNNIYIATFKKDKFVFVYYNPNGNKVAGKEAYASFPDANIASSVATVVGNNPSKYFSRKTILAVAKTVKYPVTSRHIKGNYFREHINNANRTLNFLHKLFNNEKIEHLNPLVDLRFRNQSFYRVGDIPFYIYPVEPAGKVKLKSKHNEFVMAHCLFGGAIQGFSDDGTAYQLIDHNLQVKDIITSVKVKNHFHLYEITTLSAFVPLLKLMQQLTDSEGQFRITYHIPVADYLLYGVRLFIQGQLCFSALNHYVAEVQKRGKAHREILTSLAQSSKVSINIVSPFDNLFNGGSENLSAEDVLAVFTPNDQQLDELITYQDSDVQELYRGIEFNRKRNDNNRAAKFLYHINELNKRAYIKEHPNSKSEVLQEKNSVKQKIREIYENAFVNNILKVLTTVNKDLMISEADLNSLKMEMKKGQGEYTAIEDAHLHEVKNLESLKASQLNQESSTLREITKKKIKEATATISSLSSSLKGMEADLEAKVTEFKEISEKLQRQHHFAIWKNIGENKEMMNEVKSLKDLFQLANTLVIAFAASKEAKYEDTQVYSLLPLDEKLIAEHYHKRLAPFYGEVISLFWLPPVLNYDCFKQTDGSSIDNHRDNLFRLEMSEKDSEKHMLYKEYRQKIFNKMQLTGIQQEFFNAIEKTVLETRPTPPSSPEAEKETKHRYLFSRKKPTKAEMESMLSVFISKLSTLPPQERTNWTEQLSSCLRGLNTSSSETVGTAKRSLIVSDIKKEFQSPKSQSGSSFFSVSTSTSEQVPQVSSLAVKKAFSTI